MLKILIADDHAVVRKGLRQILSQITPWQALEEAADGSQTMEKLQAARYDIVILDISMPGRGGLDILKQIKTEYPRILVLILSIHPKEQYALRALRSGAAGYLTKESAPEELLEAVLRVSAGKRYITAGLADRLAEAASGNLELPPHGRLSDREYQVLLLIASGKTIGEIAGQLCLSVKTVSTYRARVLTKMGFENNSQLTHYAHVNGLIE